MKQKIEEIIFEFVVFPLIFVLGGVFITLFVLKISGVLSNG